MSPEPQDQNGNSDSVGTIPAQIKKAGFKVYKYVDVDKLANRIEEAARLAGK